MRSFIRKLAWLTQRRRKETELRAELEFHLEEEAEELHQDGLPAQEAKWAAQRDLGNVTLLEERIRGVWISTFWEQLIQDTRYALRMMRKNLVFTLLATLLLALGIGANTAIYSFMDALLVQSLPVSDPQSLVVLNWHLSGEKDLRKSVVEDVSGHFYDDPKTGKTTSIFPYPAFELLRTSSDVLSVLFAYHPGGKLTIMTQGQAEIATSEYVSGDYFHGLGLAPAAGRLISPGDDRMGGPAVVVLSYAFAQRHFSNLTATAGQEVMIDNVPFTAIGVAPQGFFGVDPSKAPDFYLPLHADLLLSRPENRKDERYIAQHYYWIEMMGRLKPGVTLQQAQASLGPAFEQWVATTATTEEQRKNLPEFLLKEGAGGLDNLRRDYSPSFYMLLALVGLILAIACANIANLLLARATVRKRELAVRLTLGAGRGRVIRQLLTESLLLAAAGGTAGILFAVWGIRSLTLLLTAGTDDFRLRPELNWHVLAAAAAITMLTGILFGLAPALEATKVDVIPALKELRSGERRSRLRFSLGRMLVVLQIAISMLLVVAAGLFVHTLSNLHALEMGFDRENILLFQINARQAGHKDPEIIPFFSGLQQRFAAIPGVRSVTLANSALIGDGAWGWPVVPVGKQRPEHAPTGHGSGMDATATRVLATGPGFFSIMKIPLLAGREFDERDRLGSSAVAIVNEAWVKTNLPGQNPVGRQVVSYTPGLKPQQMEIVGLVRNARYDDVAGEFPSVVYTSFEQNLNAPVEQMTFFLRTTGDPLTYANTVREIVHQADARIPVTNLQTQAAQIDNEMLQEILFARLCTGFAVLALAIACIGLYGMMSYSVARRTSEIGIRMALGAQRAAVVWMVLREVVILAVVGLAIGVPISLGTSQFVESFLFGIKANDPRSLVMAVAILLTAALLAGYLPARRASHIDPVIALRHE